MAKNKTLIFCSTRALYPPYLKAAEILVAQHGLTGHIITPEDHIDSPVWQPSGPISRATFDSKSTPLTVHFLPAKMNNAGRFGFLPSDFSRLLKLLDPDYVWIHEEFWQGIAFQVLWHYRFRRGQRIVACVMINHIKRSLPLFSRGFLSRTRLKQILLWPRLDGVMACATKTMDCARRMGLPRSVPVHVNFLPVFGPDYAAPDSIPLPWRRNESFIVGFAGLISEQKGWRVLAEAVERLPEKFKLVIAGDGPQVNELKACIERPGLNGRAIFLGLLSKARLLATYPIFDVFVLPSVTLPYSVEQFGAVLAEAMGCGVPVIGSSSGAIPETIGNAGLVVPERDPDALAGAILKISEEERLRVQFSAAGKERFQAHYSCESYADSISKLFSLNQN